MDPALPARDTAPEVSVVMPAHNEADLLPTTIAQVSAALRARRLTFEIVVVENGSSDRTLAIATARASEDPALQVASLPVPDYGEAMRTGILRARAPVVVVFDVDYYEADFLDRALPRLEAGDGPAIVVGSKRAPGTHDTRPWFRRAITAGFGVILRYGFALQVSDTHGMKAMRRAAIEPIVANCRFGTDLFDTELVLRAARSGLAVVEVPVTVAELRPSRTPITRRIARTIVGLIRLRLLLWRDPKHEPKDS
jgi:glycosyltransferase involved in cell wall biosynthesis